jgi:hypothetical protein
MFVFIRYRQRRLGITEWSKRWKALPKARRRRIWTAVKRGQAASSPDDAALAIAAIDATQNLLRPSRPGSRLLLDIALPILWLALLLGRAHGDVKRVVIYGWPILILLTAGPTVRIAVRGRRRAFEQARALNEELIASSHKRL